MASPTSGPTPLLLQSQWSPCHAYSCSVTLHWLLPLPGILLDIWVAYVSTCPRLWLKCHFLSDALHYFQNGNSPILISVPLPLLNISPLCIYHLLFYFIYHLLPQQKRSFRWSEGRDSFSPHCTQDCFSRNSVFVLKKWVSFFPPNIAPCAL